MAIDRPSGVAIHTNGLDLYSRREEGRFDPATVAGRRDPGCIRVCDSGTTRRYLTAQDAWGE